MEVLHLINYFAVLASAIFFIALGATWYSPVLFGKQWMQALNIKEEDMKACGGCGKAFFWASLVSLIIALALAYFLKLTHAVTLGEGLCVAFWLWLGFIATTLASAVIWEKKPCRWWLITSGYYLVGLLVSSVILTLWK